LGIFDAFFVEEKKIPIVRELGLPDVENFVQRQGEAKKVPVAVLPPLPAAPFVPRALQFDFNKVADVGVRPCPVAGCTRAVCRALALDQCPLHTCVQCRGPRAKRHPLCVKCQADAPPAVDAAAASSSSSVSASAAATASAAAAVSAMTALPCSTGTVPSNSSVPSSADPVTVVPWSDRCRHTREETLWTPTTAPHAGLVCDKRAIVGSTYCELHVCLQCLGACDSQPALYPICTPTKCRWPQLAALQSSLPRSAATTREELMLSVARLIVHGLPEPCLLYGG
jgi:hypothetical protein